MKVTELVIIDVNGVTILDIADKNIQLVVKEGFIEVAYDANNCRRHVLVPSTNISKVIYYE